MTCTDWKSLLRQVLPSYPQLVGQKKQFLLKHAYGSLVLLRYGTVHFFGNPVQNRHAGTVAGPILKP